MSHGHGASERSASSDINTCVHGAGANPWRVIDMARDKLRLNAAAVQIPIGLEEHHAVRARGEGGAS